MRSVRAFISPPKSGFQGLSLGNEIGAVWPWARQIHDCLYKRHRPSKSGRGRVEDLRADMLQAYRGFLASLIAAHRLTASEATSLADPPIDVRIVDAREKSAPLPVIN